MNNDDKRVFGLMSLMLLSVVVDAQVKQQVRHDDPTVSTTQPQWPQHNRQDRVGVCGHPDTKANCEVNMDQSRVDVGTSAFYVPRPGYNILENGHRVCQPNGTWSGEAPHCGRKVSVGKSMNCSVKEYVTEEQLIYLVDGKDSSCAIIQKNILMSSGNKGHQDVELTWRMDLFEEYTAIKSIRLLFRGDITLSKVTLESNRYGQHDLPIKECKLSQNQLQQNLKELIIVPNRPQSARYIQFVTKLANRPGTQEFCEAEVYDINAPGVDQCFDQEKTTVSPKSAETTTAIHGHQCYTFESNTGNWRSANQMCAKINDGTLTQGLTLDINRFLINFSKANALSNQFWMGGKAENRPDPTKPHGYQLEWQWMNGDPVDEKLTNYQEPQENQCLVFSDRVDSGWMALSCTSYMGVLCQTEIRKCSSPQINVDVIVNRFNYSVGAIVSHRCPEGLLMSGDEERQCMSDGQWSGTPPECLDQTHHAMKEAQKNDQKNQIPEETILGVIIAAVIVGLVLIAIVAAVIVARKRGGKYKKKIHFHKESMKDGESVATVDDAADNKGDTSKLNEGQKENYNTVNPEFVQEQQQTSSP